MESRLIRFEQPDLRKARFDVGKAVPWEKRHNVELPYSAGTLIYVLRAPWEVAWQDLEDGETYAFNFPAGFVTDLSSVPRPARMIIDRVSMGEGPPLPHDLLYRHKGVPPRDWLVRWSGGAWVPSPRVFSRAWADRFFREMQKADGIRPFVRWASWLGVRANLLAIPGWP